MAGRALRSAYVAVPDAPDLNFPSSVHFSIDAWIRAAKTDGDNVILSKLDPATTVGYEFGLRNPSSSGGPGALYLKLGDGSLFGTHIATSPFPADGLWHHVAVAVDASAPQPILFYTDGSVVPASLAGSIPTQGVSNAVQLTIGSPSTTPNARRFQGDLDEVDLYNQPLAAGDVSSLFAAGMLAKCGAERAQTVSGPIIDASPIGHEFKCVGFGQSAEWSFLVTNVDAKDVRRYGPVGDLTLFGALTSNPEFQVTSLPGPIPYGGSAVVTVEYRPVGNGPSSGAVQLMSDAVYGASYVFLSGSGNAAPVITAPTGDLTVAVPNTLCFQVTAEDPELQPLRYTLERGSPALPPEAILNSTTGEMCWTPAPANGGDYPVRICASDGECMDCTDVRVVVLSPAYVQGAVRADCPAPGTAVQGVTVNLYQGGLLLASRRTGSNGAYSFGPLPVGTYSVSAVTPLGFTIGAATTLVTLDSGEIETVDFSLTCSQSVSTAKSLEYWKQQFAVASGAATRGSPPGDPASLDFTLVELCAQLDFIMTHFTKNTTNPVIVYEDPVAPDATDCQSRIAKVNKILNPTTTPQKVDVAKEQLLALLLNLASGKVGLNTPASMDAPARTVSQAITFCWDAINGRKSCLSAYPNHSSDALDCAAKILDVINMANKAAAGVIPSGTALIAYRTGGDHVRFAVTPNPTLRGRTFRFSTSKPGRVLLAIYDVSGRLIARPTDGWRDPGTHDVVWNGRDSRDGTISQGIYFARLVTPSGTQRAKILQLGP